MKELRKLESQLKALEFVLNKGLVKNPYALQGKISQLQKKIENQRREIAWSNFLSQ